MKTKYKYIYFEKYVDDRWICRNKKTKNILGLILFYKQWKQYVIEFGEDCVFNNTCLNDISHFLSQLNSVNSVAKNNEVRKVKRE